MKTQDIKAIQEAIEKIAGSVDQSVTHDGLNNCDTLAFLRGRVADMLKDAEYDEKRAAENAKNSDHARSNAAAGYASIKAMVASLECDRDRLEELEDSRMPFCAGWNMPGYMPDNMPDNFATWEDARDYIAEELDRVADELREDAQSSGDDATAAILETAAEELRNMDKPAASDSGTFYGCTIGNYHYFITAAEFDGMPEDDYSELQELREARGEWETEDDARQAIEEDALSVEVRSGWYTPGCDSTPEDFCILLTTGGPALRIRGELDQHGQPSRAWLEYQDWFTPWCEYHGEHGTETEVSQDVLLSYCNVFYFGE